jgi:hypothetical protein
VIHYLKKNIFKIILKNYYFILFVFLINESQANLTRSTTFDERPKCESSKGMWRDFGNSCADKCEYKFQKYPYCSNAIVYSCDCGKNRCLYQDQCIEIQDYLGSSPLQTFSKLKELNEKYPNNYKIQNTKIFIFLKKKTVYLSRKLVKRINFEILNLKVRAHIVKKVLSF